MSGMALIRNIRKKDRKKKMAMAPRLLFSINVLMPKKSKKDFNGRFWGPRAAPSVVVLTVELSAILSVSFLHGEFVRNGFENRAPGLVFACPVALILLQIVYLLKVQMQG